MAKNTICLWYDKDAEAAARFYSETFPNSVVGVVHRAPSDYPSGKEGDVLKRRFARLSVSRPRGNAATLRRHCGTARVFSGQAETA
jgi:predicted 3-demethylubiquinone-9 3-methyltransferase (glyoxalase superfamily)